MAVKEKSKLSEAIISSLSLLFFSFFIQAGLPLKIISLLLLIIPAFYITKNTGSLTDLKKITGENTEFKSILIYTIIGLFAGLMLSILYRWHLDIKLLPSNFRSFIFVAALIGSIEELVFRGYLQGLVSEFNPSLSVIISTVAHTAYKCCLFISPFSNISVDIGFLAFWTFLIGLLYGIIRNLSGSIVPSLASHALFDILVYGELVSAPLWVW